MNSPDLVQNSDAPYADSAAVSTRAAIGADPDEFRWNRWDSLWLVLLALAAVAAVWRYWKPGIPNLGDMLMGIFRVYLLEQDWRYALIYPRIATDLNFGYGAPLFEYYPPLASAVTLMLKAPLDLGYVTASKVMSTLTMMPAASGAYVFARILLQNRAAALTSGVIYLFSPYLLLTLYERGAAAELLALALVPWLLWSYHRLLIRPAAGRLILAAVITALVMLAHNITSLFAVPLALLWLALHARRARTWRALGMGAAAAALGLGLTAFYWLPAMGEIGYAELQESVLDEFLSVGQHLKSADALFQTQILFDYWYEERFQFALVTLVLGIIGSAGIVFQRRPIRFSLILLALAWVLIQLLQLEGTIWFWTKVPLIEFIQFPWRLYGFASLAIAVLAGSLLCLATTGVERGAVAAALMILAVAPAVYNADPDLSPIWYQVGDADIDRKYLYQHGRQGFSLFTDYTPNDLAVAGHELSLPRPADVPVAPPLSVEPAITMLKASPFYLAMQVNADAPWPLRLHRVFFPGWQIYADGERLATAADANLGVVTAQVPAGSYLIEAKFEQTTLRRLADGVAVAALSVLLVIAVRMLPLSRRERLALVALALAGIIAMPHMLRIARDRAAHEPVAVQARFADAVQLLGYQAPTSPWIAGETIPIRLYWLAASTPQKDYKIFVHLVRMDDSGREAQSDEQPRLGYSPMTRWLPGEVIDDLQELVLDPDVPPGRYMLALGVYDPMTMQNLSVSGADQLPGDRVLMTEITVLPADGEAP